MMRSRLYSIGEVCALFSIDAATLRRWRARLNILPHIDPSNTSRRLYTAAQVLALAQAHRRFAVPVELEQSGELLQALVEMDRRLRLAEQHIAELRDLLAERPGSARWGMLRLVMDE